MAEEKKTRRELVRLVGPEGLKTEEQRKAFAEGIADDLLPLVQAERKRQGLPPLA
jgi:hypothetical protein